MQNWLLLTIRNPFLISYSNKMQLKYFLHRPSIHNHRLIEQERIIAFGLRINPDKNGRKKRKETTNSFKDLLIQIFCQQGGLIPF